MDLTHEQKEFLKSFGHCDLPRPTRVQSKARQQCRLEALPFLRMANGGLPRRNGTPWSRIQAKPKVSNASARLCSLSIVGQMWVRTSRLTPAASAAIPACRPLRCCASPSCSRRNVASQSARSSPAPPTHVASTTRARPSRARWWRIRPPWRVLGRHRRLRRPGSW